MAKKRSSNIALMSGVLILVLVLGFIVFFTSYELNITGASFWDNLWDKLLKIDKAELSGKAITAPTTAKQLAPVTKAATSTYYSYADIIAGQRSDSAASSAVRIFLSSSGTFQSTPSFQWNAFGSGNTNGEVVLASCDTDGDGMDEIIAGAEQGSAANIIRIFDYQSTAPSQQITSFGSATKGINIACGDFDNKCIDKDGDNICGSFIGGPPVDGNVLLMHMDEANGPVIADSSGNNNNGNVIIRSGNANIIGYSMPGTSGSSLYFDNSFGYCCSATNQNRTYISVPASTYGILRPPWNVTIAAWVNPTQFANPYDNYVIDKCRTTTISGQTLSCGASDYGLRIGSYGRLVFNVVLKTGASTAQNFEVSTYIMKVNEWQHIAGVYNGSGLYLYYNGNVVTNLTDNLVKNRQIITQNTGPLRIGSANDIMGGQYYLYDNSYNGYIDEVAIYNRSLSADEVKQLYQSTIKDCNDYDSKTYQNAPELCGDGVDNNCDFVEDENCAEICRQGYVRCNWQSNYNQPMRCGVQGNGDITWINEGENCNLQNKKCYATTIKPQVGYELGYGLVGCVGPNYIEPDRRTVSNEYGRIQFPEGINLVDGVNVYPDCIFIYDGYIKVDDALCPELASMVPAEVSLSVRERSLQGGRVRYDSNDDGIFESEIAEKTVAMYSATGQDSILIINFTLGGFSIATTAQASTNSGSSQGECSSKGGNTSESCSSTCRKETGNTYDGIDNECNKAASYGPLDNCCAQGGNQNCNEKTVCEGKDKYLQCEGNKVVRYHSCKDYGSKGNPFDNCNGCCKDVVRDCADIGDGSVCKSYANTDAYCSPPEKPSEPIDCEGKDKKSCNSLCDQISGLNYPPFGCPCPSGTSCEKIGDSYICKGRDCPRGSSAFKSVTGVRTTSGECEPECDEKCPGDTNVGNGLGGCCDGSFGGDSSGGKEGCDCPCGGIRGQYPVCGAPRVIVCMTSSVAACSCSVDPTQPCCPDAYCGEFGGQNCKDCHKGCPNPGY